jgi:hypothetical protein
MFFFYFGSDDHPYSNGSWAGARGAIISKKSVFFKAKNESKIIVSSFPAAV